MKAYSLLTYDFLCDYLLDLMELPRATGGEGCANDCYEKLGVRITFEMRRFMRLRQIYIHLRQWDTKKAGLFKRKMGRFDFALLYSGEIVRAKDLL